MIISIMATIISTTIKITILSLLVPSVLRGGVGAGAPGGVGAAIRSAIMATATRMDTALRTVMVMAVGLKYPSYSADSHAPVTTMGRSMGS